MKNANSTSLFVLGCALLLIGQVVFGVLVALAGVVMSTFTKK